MTCPDQNQFFHADPPIDESCRMSLKSVPPPFTEPRKPLRYQKPPETAHGGATVLSFGLFEVRRGAEMLAALPLREAFTSARIAMSNPTMTLRMRAFEDRIGEARWYVLDVEDRTTLLLEYLYMTIQDRKAPDGR